MIIKKEEREQYGGMVERSCEWVWEWHKQTKSNSRALSLAKNSIASTHGISMHIHRFLLYYP